MFEGLTLRGDASDGDAAPRVRGLNTPNSRSRGSPCGRWGGRDGRGCGHRDGLSSGDGAGAAEQAQQGALLLQCAGVGGIAMLIEAPFVADAERVLVVAYGVGTDQLFVARLVGPAVACDVVVVARKSEAIRVTADECCHGKASVTARGRTMNHNQIDVAHDCTKNELIIAVSTVMMNWMMVFQRFMSLKNFIVFQMFEVNTNILLAN